jgi:circadian clock protein KaiC
MPRDARHDDRPARMTTGTPGLDEVLRGGIPKGSSVFVTGLPGSGKTVLSEQALFANARRADSVLYVTTLSEPPLKMLRFSQGFDFFRPELIDRVVRFCDIGGALRSEGAAGALRQLEEIVRTYRPELMVLDSFKVFREYFDELRELRAFVAEITVLLATWEVTSLLVGEYSLEEVSSEPEFAIADGILHLSGTEERQRQKRYINVLKMRGTDPLFGRHSFEISDAGMTVYPRMLPRVQAEYALSEERVGSAIAGLATMMGGGVPAGSVMLISGGTGTGKTLVAFSVCVAAAGAGAPALFVTFEEAPNQLIRNSARLGWPVEDLMSRGLIEFLHVSPSELDIDRHSIELRDRASKMGAKVVVIDGIGVSGLTRADGDAVASEYMWALADYFKRTGTTLILTDEAYSFFESGQSAPEAQRRSYLADSIVLLRLREEGNEVRRVISVLKMRGSGHDTSLRELHITEDGIKIDNVT